MGTEHPTTTHRSVAYCARPGDALDIIGNNVSDGNVIAAVQPGDWALSYMVTIGAMP
jgi:hypothetical protein